MAAPRNYTGLNKIGSMLMGREGSIVAESPRLPSTSAFILFTAVNSDTKILLSRTTLVLEPLGLQIMSCNSCSEQHDERVA
jgi:hypothetical protein